MSVPTLGRIMLAFALSWATLPLSSAETLAVKKVVARPQITSLVIRLEDGRSYALSTQQLTAPKGGAIFWGDWAVANLLVPHYAFRPSASTTVASVVRLWFTAGASGELPAFLVCTPEGPIYPLEPATAAKESWTIPSFPRPRIAGITIGFADGRVFSLNEFALRDPKSGVLLWNDYAIANLLIPFYRAAQNLPTSPEDVMRFWHSPRTAQGFSSADVAPAELPGYTVKPACIPEYPVADPVQ